MKTIFLFISAFILSTSIGYSQEIKKDSSSFETLTKKGHEKVKVSGFGCFNFDMGGISNDFALYLGAEGAILLNGCFYIGGYGRGLTNLPSFSFTYFDVTAGLNTLVDARGTFFHGGLLVGGEFFHKKRFHFGISGKLGAGNIGMIYRESTYYASQYYYKNLMTVMVITPQADFIVNVTSWFKIKVGIGYQWTSNGAINYSEQISGIAQEKELFNSSKLRSVIGSVGFSFGGFK